jgi:hypothetical protein
MWLLDILISTYPVRSCLFARSQYNIDDSGRESASSDEQQQQQRAAIAPLRSVLATERDIGTEPSDYRCADSKKTNRRE